MDAQYAEQYESLARNHWWWQARARLVLREMQRLSLPSKASILDVGCGGGWAFDDWLRFGDVRGVELDESLVARAGVHASRIHCGPFDSAYVTNERFDLIVMLDVLEHLPNPKAAIEHASALLKPSGRLLITVPAMPSCWTRHDELNHHYVRFTRRSFRELIHGQPLEIERLEYFFHWTTLAKWLVRAKEAVITTKPASPKIPPPILNGLLCQGSLLEQRLFSWAKFPFGTSLFCVACSSRKEGGALPHDHLDLDQASLD